MVLETLEDSTENRQGNFTQSARAKMFLSWQTYEGFSITVHSAIEVVRFLLEEGMEFVLTERFCQDPVEEYFGKQRQLGRRSDNPDIHQFGPFLVRVAIPKEGKIRRKLGNR